MTPRAFSYWDRASGPQAHPSTGRPSSLRSQGIALAGLFQRPIEKHNARAFVEPAKGGVHQCLRLWCVKFVRLSLAVERGRAHSPVEPRGSAFSYRASG